MDDQSLLSKASSLLELDPTPIDSGSPNASDKALPPLPLPDQTDGPPSDSTSTSPNSSSTPAALGLSGTGHGAIYYLTRIQRYSSYTFTLFTTLHLATTSLIPLAARSVPSSESSLLLAREIYQTPLSEPLLVTLPVLAHVGAGLALRLLRRHHTLQRYGDAKHHGAATAAPAAGITTGWPAVSYISLSGGVFAAALAAHVAVNRVLPLVVEGDSANVGLAYVAHGFVRHGALAWAGYAVLLAAGCGHMVWGWAKWVGLAQGAGWKAQGSTGNAGLDRAVRRRRRRTFVVINAVAAAATALWAAGGLGIVARGGETPGWVGKLYDGLYERIPGF